VAIKRACQDADEQLSWGEETPTSSGGEESPAVESGVLSLESEKAVRRELAAGG